MNDLMLVDKSVLVKISDPWEIGQYLGWQPLEGRVISINENALLLKLNSPFTFENIDCEYFIVSPRHEGGNICELLNGRSIFCGLTRISADQANSSNPFDLLKWRGGIAIVGEVEPL